MKSKSALSPSGSLLEQHQQRKPRILYAFFVIVGLHVVPICGLLLMQGCKPDATSPEAGTESGDDPLTVGQAPLNTNDLYKEFTSETSALSVQIKGETQGSGAGAVTSLTKPTSLAPELDSGPMSSWETTEGPVTQQVTTGATNTLPSSSPSSPIQLVEHKVASGDLLGQLAPRYQTTVADILEANPGVRPTNLPVGYRLVIPQGSARKASSTASSARSSKPKGGAGNVYVVKAGDTLSQIATQHGVSLSRLRVANSIRSHVIHPGQELTIPIEKVASTKKP